MNYDTLAYIAPAALGAALTFWFWARIIRPLWLRARAYIANVSTCGYLPPPPTERAVRFLMRLSRFLTWVQCGKVRIIGRENLDSHQPMIVAPNHPHYIDPAVIAMALDRPARYMAARGVMRFGFGLGSLMAGPCGAFAADLTPGKGGGARLAGVRVITGGETLVMFPEGWAYLDGSLGPFKKGAVRIARESARILGKDTYIVPVFLRYGRYPGAWIKKLSPPVEYLFVFLSSWYYRRGVTAVIGKPIAASSLPGDDAAATEYLQQRIVALDPAR